jgi:hypothetical protein
MTTYIGGFLPGRTRAGQQHQVCVSAPAPQSGQGVSRQIHVAILDRVLVVLFRQQGAHQAPDRHFVGEDADDAGATPRVACNGDCSTKMAIAIRMRISSGSIERGVSCATAPAHRSRHAREPEQDPRGPSAGDVK